jgi:protein-disulfide isomerase
MQIEAAAGTIFGSDFRIERELGRGGMGVVYIATQLSTGHERALKLMHPGLLRSDEMRRRFEQEAKVGSKIKSEHVVQVIAAGVDGKSDMPWLAMERLEGEDLECTLARRGRLELEEAWPILAQICHALGAAHSVGIVHRDLKPENVFLARSHREGAPVTVKLLDFGIAKLVAEAGQNRTAPVGTPLWMAPEQTGGTVSPATDVWALGLLAFWMLTGKVYWRLSSDERADPSVMGVLKQVVFDELSPASARATALGCDGRLVDGFDDWFAKCVARNSEERFQNASEARSGFQRLVVGSEDTAPAACPPEPSSAPIPATERMLAPTVAVTSVTARQTRPAAPTRRWVPLALGAAAVAVVALVAIRPWKLAEPAAPPVAAAAPPSAPPPAESGPPPKPAPPMLEPGERAVDQLDSRTVWKIPIGDSPQRGPRQARVTIVEFANFQCPYTKALAGKLRALLAEYPESVRLVWKDDPLAVHSLAEDAAHVARLARARQGEAGFWAAHDVLVDVKLKPERAKLIEVAKKLGLEPSEIEQALQSRSHLAAINQDAYLADDFAVIGTPTFFVNGRRIQPTDSLDTLRAAVKQELDKTEALVKSGIAPEHLYDHLLAEARGPLPFETRRFQGSARTPSWGGSTPQVHMIEFCTYASSDAKAFLCRLVDPTIQEILAEGKEKLRLTWVDVPEEDELSRTASLASRLTWLKLGEERFLEMRRLLFDAGKQGKLTRNAVLRFGEQVGFTRQALTADLEEPEFVGELALNVAQARKQQIEVPGFLVCGRDLCLESGYYLSGLHPRRAFERRIRLVLEHGGVTPPAR